jgi:hypothetical protein
MRDGAESQPKVSAALAALNGNHCFRHLPHDEHLGYRPEVAAVAGVASIVAQDEVVVNRNGRRDQPLGDQLANNWRANATNRAGLSGPGWMVMMRPLPSMNTA